MKYQLSWKTEPGLRGLSCSGFRAVAASPEAGPDDHALQDGVVLVEFASDAERDTFLRHLEGVFAPQRFSNNAAAFEAVKTYALDWAASRSAAAGSKQF